MLVSISGSTTTKTTQRVSMDQLQTSHSTRELRWFGWLFAVFNFALAYFFVRPWGVGWPVYTLWGAVVTILVVIYYSLPRYQSKIYRGWLTLVSPIGSLVTQAILCVIFCLIIVPVGWIMKRIGYDPLDRKVDRQQISYWNARKSDSIARDYFKQY